MNKVVVLLWLVAIVIAAAGLFHVKYRVQRLEEDLSFEHRSILSRQEAIHILKAEWSYLNQPSRLSDLAERHLGLAPLDSSRLVRLDDLPPRPERREERASADLDAVLAHARRTR